MSNQVQIDIMLFLDMCNLIKCKDKLSKEEYDKLYRSVCPRIDDKLQRITSRILYSDYKRATTKEERERALAEYLREKDLQE